IACQPAPSDRETRGNHSTCFGREFPQRACNVLCSFLWPAFLVGRDSVEKRSPLALRLAHHFGALCHSGWPLAHLPGGPLGQRCDRGLSLRRNAAGDQPLDLSQAQRKRCAGLTTKDESGENSYALELKRRALKSNFLREHVYIINARASPLFRDWPLRFQPILFTAASQLKK